MDRYSELRAHAADFVKEFAPAGHHRLHGA